MFKNLPVKTQEEVKEVLGGYPKCYVIKTNDDEYEVSTGFVNMAYRDYKNLYEFEAKNILTKEELIISYAKNFTDFHDEYRGKRDYGLMREVRNDRSIKLKLDEEGNIVKA